MSNGTRSWDVYYFSPGGAKFRSKAAVARELGLEPPTRGGRGRKAADDDDDDEPPPKSRPPPLDEEEEIFSVDALLARRPAPKGGRGVEYLVRWEARAAAIPYSAIPPQFCAAAAHRTPFRRAQGYGRAEDLWVPAGNILDKSLVRVFEAARSKPPPLNLSPHEGRGGGGDHHEERNDVRTWSGAKPSPRPRPSLFGMGSPTHGPMSPGARPAPPPESDPTFSPKSPHPSRSSRRRLARFVRRPRPRASSRPPARPALRPLAAAAAAAAAILPLRQAGGLDARAVVVRGRRRRRRQRRRRVRL